MGSTGGVRSALACTRLGLAAGAATLAVYLPGSGRPLDYDSAVTAARFIRTPSLLDPLRRQLEFNNHVLFSFLGRLVVGATGRSDELILRSLSIAAGVAFVVLVVSAAHRWFGPRPALVAAVVVVANPTFADNIRAVRGYGLMCLAAAVSTLTFLAMLRTSASRAITAVYVVAVAAGIATHLYFGLVVVGHAAAVVGSRVALRPWIVRWGASLAIALPWYAGVARYMANQDAPRSFDPLFPRDLLVATLGGTWVSVLLLGPVVGYALWRARREVALLWALAACGVVVAGLWIVLQSYLFPRFVVWVVGGVALAAAFAVRERPWLAVPTIAAVVVALVATGPSFNEPVLANRTAAQILDATTSHGAQGCATDGNFALPLEAYTDNYQVVENPAQLAGCDVVVALRPTTTRAVEELLRSAGREFAFKTVLDARVPAVVLSREPLVTNSAQR